MTTSPDVLVVGGGVIGLTAAYFLAKEGVQVAVLDRGDLGQEASWAGAGILTAGNPEGARTPIDSFRAHSCRMFPDLSTELRERTGIDNGFLHSGGLEFLGPGGDVSEEWAGEGTRSESWSEQQTRAAEPALAAGLGPARFLPDMAQIRNPRHLKALIAACQSFGVTLLPGRPVLTLLRDGARIEAVETSAGLLHADQFVVASGSWTNFLLEPLGFHPRIEPVRGQIALLNPGRVLFQRFLLVGAHYLVSRSDGLVLAGSTEEHAGFDKRTTAQAIHDLLQLAIRLVPALAAAALERTWAGLRPASPDGLPYIGPVPGIDNLYLAGGHYRSGIQLSPATARMLKELILHQPLTLPQEPFRLERSAEK